MNDLLPGLREALKEAYEESGEPVPDLSDDELLAALEAAEAPENGSKLP